MNFYANILKTIGLRRLYIYILIYTEYVLNPNPFFQHSILRLFTNPYNSLVYYRFDIVVLYTYMYKRICAYL